MNPIVSDALHSGVFRKCNPVASQVGGFISGLRPMTSYFLRLRFRPRALASCSKCITSAVTTLHDVSPDPNVVKVARDELRLNAAKDGMDGEAEQQRA